MEWLAVAVVRARAGIHLYNIVVWDVDLLQALYIIKLGVTIQ